MTAKEHALGPHTPAKVPKWHRHDARPFGSRRQDTVNVGPGERYDGVWTAQEPGRWLLHCHINHHTTNDNQEQDGAGGLTHIIEVS